MSERYEYKSENVPGNLHELAHTINKESNYLTDGGWELVTADSSGRYTVAIFRRRRKSRVKLFLSGPTSR
jgi:hypothetical protein